jgi:FAD/FMN-containing dehydrogenase
MGGTKAAQLELLPTLTDAVVEALAGSHAPTVEVRHWGGAIARAGDGSGPAGHRQLPLSVIADVPDLALARALRPHATGATFLNFLSDPARTASAFTRDNYARLRAIKTRYDADNLFRTGHAITPALNEVKISSSL